MRFPLASPQWFTHTLILKLPPAGRPCAHTTLHPPLAHAPPLGPSWHSINSFWELLGVGQAKHIWAIRNVDQMVDHKEPTCHELANIVSNKNRVLRFEWSLGEDTAPAARSI
jgi:hypothetical protein